ncbi:MAG: hypothetical protein CR974_00115 [Gammaproteobacteria bacterium]|nr:MAG: hypothetical protein CR974_00115 [Gammaproteobacteria bacterium]
MKNQKLKTPVYLLALGYGLGTTVAVMSVAICGLIGAELTPHPALSTLPYGLQFIGVMLSALTSSMLQSRFGRKKIIFAAAGLGIIAGGIGISAVTMQSFALLCLTHFVIGVFFANIALLRFAVMDLTPRILHSKALSMVMFGGTFAALVGPVLSRNLPHLFSRLNVYQTSYFAISAIAAIILTLVLFLRFPKVQKTELKPVAIKQLLSNRVYVFALVCGGVGYSLMNLIMINSSIQMKANGFDFSAVSYYIQIHVFAMYFPSLFNMKILERLGLQRFLTLGLVLQLLVSIVFIFGQNAATFFVSLLVLGLSWNMLYTGGSYIVGHIFSREEEKFKAQGTQDLFIAAMSSIGALSAGAVLGFLGWNVQHVLAIVVTLALTVFFVWVRPALAKQIAAAKKHHNT